MSKLFIKSIIQHGGDLTDSDRVVILNTASKHINKKMKIIEYDYRIKLKLPELPIDNWDCLPKKVGIQTYAQIDGPLKGRIPIYTKTNLNIPTPTISTVTAGIPVTPFGPVVGVPALSINPFGNINSLDERIDKARKYLEILNELSTQLDNLKNRTIEKKDVSTKYFEFVDLNEVEPIEEFERYFKSKEKYSNL